MSHKHRKMDQNHHVLQFKSGCLHALKGEGTRTKLNRIKGEGE